MSYTYGHVFVGSVLFQGFFFFFFFFFLGGGGVLLALCSLLFSFPTIEPVIDSWNVCFLVKLAFANIKILSPSQIRVTSG